MNKQPGSNVLHTLVNNNSSDDDKDIEEMQKEVENIICVQIKAKSMTSPVNVEPALHFSVNVKVEPVDEPQQLSPEITDTDHSHINSYDSAIEYLVRGPGISSSTKQNRELSTTSQLSTQKKILVQKANNEVVHRIQSKSSKSKVVEPVVNASKGPDKCPYRNKGFPEILPEVPVRSLYTNLKTYTRKPKEASARLQIPPKVTECSNVNVNEENVKQEESKEISNSPTIKVEPAEHEYNVEIDNLNDELNNTGHFMNEVRVEIKQEVDDEFYEDDIIMVDEGDIINIPNMCSVIDKINDDGDGHDVMEHDSDHSHNTDLAGTDTEDEDYVISNDGITTKRKKIYKCKKCNFKGFHKEFMIHQWSYTKKSDKKLKRYFWADINSFTCTKCNKAFSKVKMYLKHFKEHGYKSLSCPECCQKFSDYSKLVPHFYLHVRSLYVSARTINQDKNTKILKNQCKQCQSDVKCSQVFQHWEKHFELKPNLPNNIVDNTEFAPERRELQHIIDILRGKVMNSKQKEPKKPRWCDLCSRPFNRANDCKRHFIEHLLEDAYQGVGRNKGLQCQMCGEVTDTHSSYKSHLRYHASLPVYKCDLCNKTFSDSSNFAKHKKTHNLNTITCDICQKKFSLKNQLNKHIKMHETTKPIKCKYQICGKLFFTESSYKKHLANIHEKTTPRFRCNICKMQFSALRVKWDHMWDEHQVRKFIADCPVCRMPFRKFHDVKVHLAKVHNLPSFHLKRLNTLTETEKNGNLAQLADRSKKRRSSVNESITIKEEIIS